MVAAMPAVEEMHQRAQRQQEERQRAHQVRSVLHEKEEAGHREEAEQHPRQRGAALRVATVNHAWTPCGTAQPERNGSTNLHDQIPYGE
jgi:hypothetical protein